MAAAFCADDSITAANTASINTTVTGATDFFMLIPFLAVSLPDCVKVRRNAITCHRCSSLSLSLYPGILEP